MKLSFLRVLPALALIVVLGTGASFARDLTFEQRVAAQEAIERVYYSHQIRASLPFEQAVPREVLEKKVRTYLKQSVALEQLWRTPVTARMLQEEMERIRRSTRMPERLREVFQALGNDPFVIRECLARPTLVDHLARSFFSADERIHLEARAEADDLRARLLSGQLNPEAEASNRSVITAEPDVADSGTGQPPERELVPISDSEAAHGLAAAEINEFGASEVGAFARDGGIGAVLDAQNAFVVKASLPEESEGARIAVYTFPKVSWDSWWNLHQDEFDESRVAAVAEQTPAVMSTVNAVDSGSLDCTGGDTWSNGSLDALPEPRSYNVANWTGNVMVIWGGSLPIRSPYIGTNTGGRYDPLTDSWLPMSAEGAPQGRAYATAVWTGREMIVWGGETSLISGALLGAGGRYDPVRDVWSPISTFNAPAPRIGHTAVWTGREMVIWGGSIGNFLQTNSGGRYDPSFDRWLVTNSAGAPEPRAWHQAVWTGSAMIIWGGVRQIGSSLNFPIWGGRYNPTSDGWQATAGENSPVGRQQFTAVWTGSEMVVWGGLGSCVLYSGNFYICQYLSTGGRYDPVLDRWQAMSTEGETYPRMNPKSVWTGAEMLVWGGTAGFPSGDGARYDPAADRWAPISNVNAPSGRSSHTAVWTGDRMIVWGGSLQPNGGRYDPATDTWTPTAMPNLTLPRLRSTAIWTGSEMVVWGGFDSSFNYPTNEGSRYDPALDRWASTSRTNAPASRGDHSAVWTGSAMVIWGGGDNASSSSLALNSGGRYDPRSDSWSATAAAGAPAARRGHSAIWTGSRMILWGGVDRGFTYFNTGAQYDPGANAWTPLSTVNAPTARSGHSAVWTGTEMVVWGGSPGSEVNTGGRYDPTNDRWMTTSPWGAPSARRGHAAVWTGSEMIIWGGVAGSMRPFTGARYNPAQDSWQDMSLLGVPLGRTGQATIWTGKEMIVWGGQADNQPLNSGGRYDPALDRWRGTSLYHAPEGRWDHTAVWTGKMMIIWGGPNNRSVPTGGRYFPDPPGQQVAAEAGGNLTAECSSPHGTPVPLSGAGNSCDESAQLAYWWSGPFSEGGGSIQGAAPTVTLPLGDSTLTLHVDDGQGHSAMDTLTVTVRDTMPPVITLMVTPSVLWPPNHRMVDVNASEVTTDACSTPTVVLTSITSSEPDDAPGAGDGTTQGDIQGAEIGTDHLGFQLRAERDGSGEGRAYRMTCTATDGSGNQGSATSIVYVPHDLGTGAEPLVLSTDNTTAGTLLRWDPVPGASSYKAIRGAVGSLHDAGAFIDLGTVSCIQPDSSFVSTVGREDAEIPPLGRAFFYAVGYNNGADSGYGSDTVTKPRVKTGGGCE